MQTNGHSKQVYRPDVGVDKGLAYIEEQIVKALPSSCVKTGDWDKLFVRAGKQKM